MTGRLFVVVGASGAGKDTLLAGAVKADPTLYWARRVITRPEVSGGEPFEGVDRASFDARRAAGEFALNWEAHGLSYGVPKAELAPLSRSDGDPHFSPVGGLGRTADGAGAGKQSRY